MSAARRWVLASGNAGKIREFGALLAPLGVELVGQRELGIPDAPEPHPSFVENAIAKARHAAAAAGLPALADDSGLCVSALGGAPGVHSARWAQLAGGPKDDRANNARLVSQLQGVADRRAHFYCVLVLMRSADDPQPIIADGAWHGEFIDTPRGEGGFGYDPHFWLPDQGCTSAELPAARKNLLSHRALAWRDLLDKARRGGWIESSAS